VPAVGLVAVAVGRPGHHVRHTRADVLQATGTPVRLHGRRTEDVPNHPLTVLPLLDPILGDSRPVRTPIIIVAAAGMVAAGAHKLKST
jgi:hypothetical protein